MGSAGWAPLLETWLSVLSHDPPIIAPVRVGQEPQRPQSQPALAPWAEGPTGKTPEGVGYSKLPVAQIFGERLSSFLPADHPL